MTDISLRKEIDERVQPAERRNDLLVFGCASIDDRWNIQVFQGAHEHNFIAIADFSVVTRRGIDRNEL